MLEGLTTSILSTTMWQLVRDKWDLPSSPFYMLSLCRKEVFSLLSNPECSGGFEKDQWGLEKSWVPSNSDDKYEGLMISMKFGLTNSINTITAYIMKQFGPHVVVDLAKGKWVLLQSFRGAFCLFRNI